MKRGTIIIGKNEEFGISKEEIDEYTRHAEVMQKYCKNKKLDTSIPKDNLNGYLWGKTLAKHGEFVFQIEDYVILYIPTIVTNYQLEQFEVIVKDYLKRHACAFSYYERDNNDIEIAIEEDDRTVTWEQIFDDIQEKNTYFNKMEGEKDVQNIRIK